MAYETKRGGPYPNLAGEFCGNHSVGSKPLFDWHNPDPEEAVKRQEDYLARMRFGKPSCCQAGTSEEMARRGYVGLYLKEDRPLRVGETPVETDELTEDAVSRPAIAKGTAGD